MKLIRLDRSLRRNLKDLLEGYLEHCEISPHLVARIESPIYHHGFKFGAPVFTHATEAGKGNPVRTISIVGRNDPHSRLASDVLLQFMEILTQEPQLAEGAVLRLLPVANPIALEFEEDSPPVSQLPVVAHLVERFRDEPADGVLDIRSHDGETLLIEGTTTTEVLDAIQSGGIPSGRGHRRLLQEADILIATTDPGDKWSLDISIPATWTTGADIHALSGFVAHLIRLSTRQPLFS